MLELAFAPTAAVAVVAGLAVEWRLFAPGRAPGKREAVVWSAGWLLLALAVAVGIALAGGPSGEWTTVYLIERSLSLDNVFLFSLLLAYFLVPPELRGRVILIGIAGALLVRGLAIAGGVALVESVEAVIYMFGALLLLVAYRALRGADEASDPAANPMLQSSGVSFRPPTTTAGAGCSSARPVVSTARPCSWWWSRSSPPTSPSPSTRSRRPSR